MQEKKIHQEVQIRIEKMEENKKDWSFNNGGGRS